MFFNSENDFSIVIFFSGSQNDASIWESSELKEALDSGALNLPQSTGNVKFHVLGDEIFSLTERLMKPYAKTSHQPASEKIFNYRYKC